MIGLHGFADRVLPASGEGDADQLLDAVDLSAEMIRRVNRGGDAALDALGPQEVDRLVGSLRPLLYSLGQLHMGLAARMGRDWAEHPDYRREWAA